MKVNNKSQELIDLHELITPIKALLGGTPEMRRQGTTYLPKFKSEDDEGYKRRLSVATLVPYFEDTVRSMNGRFFYKQIPTDQLDSRLQDYVDDFTLSGDNLASFFESVSFEALAYSRAYVVVDYTGTGEAETRDEEIKSGARPHAFKVDVEQVLDVRREKSKITLFKYIHEVVKEETDFGVEYEQEVVLMTPKLTRRYRYVEGEWRETASSEIRVQGKEIDFVMVEELKYARKPPLLNLALLNIKHWQNQSDQDNILHTARVPILKFTGIDPEQFSEMVVSGGVVLPQGADASYVEHSGAAISAGQASLDKLEEQMAVSGAKLLIRGNVAMTDSQAKNEHQKDVSELMLYGLMLNDFMNKVLHKYGLWLGVDDDKGVDITNNLSATVASGANLQDLYNAKMANVISNQTYYEALIQHEVITGNKSYEEEVEQIEIEAEAGLSRSTSVFDGV